MAGDFSTKIDRPRQEGYAIFRRFVSTNNGKNQKNSSGSTEQYYEFFLGGRCLTTTQKMDRKKSAECIVPYCRFFFGIFFIRFLPKNRVPNF